MKIEKIKIKGLGIIKDVEIDLSKPITAIYGDIRQGKTTILHAVQLIGMRRGYPDGLINNDCTEAVITLILDVGRIEKKFTAKGAELKAVINGKKVKQTEVSKMFNPFQLDQDYFRKMNAPGRAEFLLEIFGIDTIELDKKYIETEKQAKIYRDKVRDFGTIELIKVEKPGTDRLTIEKNEEKARLTGIFNMNTKANDKLKSDWKLENERIKAECNDKNIQLKNQYKIDNDKHFLKIQEFNKKQSDNAQFNEHLNKTFDTIQRSYIELQRWCEELQGNDMKIINEFMDKQENSKPEKPLTSLTEPIYPQHELLPEPTYPKPEPDKGNYNAILEQLNEAEKQQIHYDNYLSQKAKQTEKDRIYILQLEKETEQREIKKLKATKLAEKNGIIAGLEFTPDGSFKYNDCTAGMLSDSMVDELSSNLSALYKDSVKITLIDGAEKYGKHAIDIYIKYAKRTGNDVLMSVVSEQKATNNEDANIYVIENGKIVI